MANQFLNAAGKQKWGKEGTMWDPKALQDHLLKKPSYNYLIYYDIIISKVEGRSGACMLSCKSCKKEFSCTNPDHSVKNHGKACKEATAVPQATPAYGARGKKRPWEEEGEEEEGLEGVAADSPSRNTRSQGGEGRQACLHHGLLPQCQ